MNPFQTPPGSKLSFSEMGVLNDSLDGFGRCWIIMAGAGMQDRTHGIIPRPLLLRLFGCALLALYILAAILVAPETGTSAGSETRKNEGTSLDRSTLMPGMSGGLTTRFGTFTFNPTNPP